MTSENLSSLKKWKSQKNTWNSMKNFDFEYLCMILTAFLPHWVMFDSLHATWSKNIIRRWCKDGSDTKSWKFKLNPDPWLKAVHSVLIIYDRRPVNAAFHIICAIKFRFELRESYLCENGADRLETENDNGPYAKLKHPVQINEISSWLCKQSIILTSTFNRDTGRKA